MKKAIMIFILLSTVINASYIVSNKFFGCKDIDDFENLVSFANSRDVSSFENYLTRKIITGECTVFRQGEKVTVKETKIFSGMVQVLNINGRFWTFIEAVK